MNERWRFFMLQNDAVTVQSIKKRWKSFSASIEWATNKMGNMQKLWKKINKSRWKIYLIFDFPRLCLHFFLPNDSDDVYTLRGSKKRFFYVPYTNNEKSYCKFSDLMDFKFEALRKYFFTFRFSFSNSLLLEKYYLNVISPCWSIAVRSGRRRKVFH
jgi:hypothetical protein